MVKLGVNNNVGDGKNVIGCSLLCHSDCLLLLWCTWIFHVSASSSPFFLTNFQTVWICISHGSWLGDVECGGAASAGGCYGDLRQDLMMVPLVVGWSRPACRATLLSLLLWLSVKWGLCVRSQGAIIRDRPRWKVPELAKAESDPFLPCLQQCQCREIISTKQEHVFPSSLTQCECLWK